ncbi:hypothetical protein CFE70_004734 [Pyrenophora teres f. teres 0-1]|uniref:Uncharacterized protein n=1 Tax=Pyrenophora teres f. teres (strain 0-1) TaxID=861557 RepID=E3REP7_PYRTT|nr:hypothetical protein PTT_04883 [Pyrenophora teres f. teres 0-1]KAE8849316.1 hypothetical protein HRS9122_03332 [Pyrenophora teres f. teres]KAE8866838.1 hypothetical protein PTNB73_04932 [Pyrenophora teres f. teres]
MPPSNGNALSAAVKNHQDKAAFNAQQAVADKQKQKEIEILAQQSKLYTDRAKDVVSQKLRLERELKESQQQRQQVASKPPQTPSAQAPAMTQEEINQCIAQIVLLHQHSASEAPSMQTTPSQAPAARVSTMPAAARLQASGAKVRNSYSLTPSQLFTSRKLKGYAHWTNDRSEKAARENQALYPEVFTAGPTFLGEYRFDFGAWNGAYISRVPEDYLRSCAGNNGVMRKRPELLKALFERNNAKLLNRNEMCSLEDATENQNTLQQMSSSSAIASSSPPAVFSSSPLPQFGSASSPPSSPSKAHMPEWLINFNARAAKMDRPMTAPVRPALTEAGPSTPAANTRAKSKGKAKAKAKGKGKTATYIKIEPLDTPSGVVKRRPGRPRKTVVPTQEATGPQAKKQLTLDDYKVAAHASHATPASNAPYAVRAAYAAGLAHAACASADWAKWGKDDYIQKNNNYDDEAYEYEEDGLEIIESEIDEMDLTV